MTELTPASFEQFVRVNRFAVIHFWATWNSYDIKMKDILQSQIPPELATLIGFRTFDVDPAGHGDIPAQLKLRNIPTLAFYRDGLLVQILTGIRKPDQIVECLRELVFGA